MWQSKEMLNTTEKGRSTREKYKKMKYFQKTTRQLLKIKQINKAIEMAYLSSLSPISLLLLLHYTSFFYIYINLINKNKLGNSTPWPSHFSLFIVFVILYFKLQMPLSTLSTIKLLRFVCVCSAEYCYTVTFAFVFFRESSFLFLKIKRESAFREIDGFFKKGKVFQSLKWKPR